MTEKSTQNLYLSAYTYLTPCLVDCEWGKLIIMRLNLLSYFYNYYYYYIFTVYVLSNFYISEYNHLEHMYLIVKTKNQFS